MFGNSPFGTAQSSPELRIPDDADIIFVADLFVEDYCGGAELTSQALIDASPLNVYKLRCRDITVELLEQGHHKHWVFGNFAGIDIDMVPTLVANMDYSVLEYDYKYCRYRSPEKHFEIEMSECDCHNEHHGKMISAFLYGAKSLWWMSEVQMQKYHDIFPFLNELPNCVLSSVFGDNFFINLKQLREKYKETKRKGWIVLGSTSWIKGADTAEQWCKDNGKEYEIVWGLPYEKVLEKLAQAEGFVYLPPGGDTCPRMVIEAKLLGCELHLNDFVQHKDELWFSTDDMLDTESYLYAARDRFWRGIQHVMDWQPSVSGYTTTLNCIKHDYPWRESIKSLLGFCDQVVVVDGGSDDGTWEELKTWCDSEEKLNICQNAKDWDDPRFAVFDGEQKAAARSLCTGLFCWQQDADEVVHEDDYEKIIGLIKQFPREYDLISLPVVEYWGGPKKIRLDINPWKWRLSRNKDYITHGIPMQLRRVDDSKRLYSLPGTDGCDYIHIETKQLIPHASFYNNEAHQYKVNAMAGDANALKVYQEWFGRNVEMLPGVHHYSWFDMKRKIRTYRDYWSKHWQSLYNIEQQDTAENNMFFQKPWSEVTEDDIEIMSSRLSNEMGGWVFHAPVDFSKPTPFLSIDLKHPDVMKEFLENAKQD